MLVLSRKQGETIVFPALNTTIELLKVRGSVVRVGIKAPRDIDVLRGELADETTRWFPDEPPQKPAVFQENHALRNRLNTVTVGIDLIGKYLQAGREGEARQVLASVVESLRRGEAVGAAKSQRPPATGTAPAASGDRPSPTALLVEDDANERHLLAGLLRHSGFKVETVGDGAQALDYLDGNRRPDLVLMDMLMPGCDGPTAVRTIRSDPRHQGLAIYAVSGASPESLGVDTGPSGVDGWFEKPLDTDRLIGALSREAAPVP